MNTRAAHQRAVCRAEAVLGAGHTKTRIEAEYSTDNLPLSSREVSSVPALIAVLKRLYTANTPQSTGRRWRTRRVRKRVSGITRTF
jgi:hypothetical protein